MGGDDPDDILETQRDALTVLDILCPDGDYGSPEITRIHTYMTMADIHFARNEWDTGLRHLETAVTLAVYLDIDCDGARMHTFPLFCGLVYGDYITNLPDNFSLALLHQPEKKPYLESLVATETGAMLIACLEEHAATR